MTRSDQIGSREIEAHLNWLLTGKFVVIPIFISYELWCCFLAILNAAVSVIVLLPSCYIASVDDK